MSVTKVNSVVDWLVLVDGTNMFNHDEGHWTTMPTEKAAVEFAAKRWRDAAVYRRVTRWFSDGTTRETLERLPK